MVPPNAEAEVTFRTVGSAAEIRTALEPLSSTIDLEDVVEVPPVVLETVPDFTTEIFPYTTDIPFLSAWGKPLLLGPGSVLVAHTDEEHISISEMVRSVDHYVTLARRLVVS